MESYHARLREAILVESESKNWMTAKKEWSLVLIFDEKSHCVCGHHIVQNCVIHNDINGKELIVGNVCVNQFNETKLEAEDSAYASLARMKKAGHAKANKALLELAHRTHVITESEVSRYVKLTTGKGAKNRFDPSHAWYKVEYVEFVRKSTSSSYLVLPTRAPSVTAIHLFTLARGKTTKTRPTFTAVPIGNHLRSQAVSSPLISLNCTCLLIHYILQLLWLKQVTRIVAWSDLVNIHRVCFSIGRK